MTDKKNDIKVAIMSAGAAIIIVIVGTIVAWYPNEVPTTADMRSPATFIVNSPTAPQTLPLALDSKFFPSGWMGDGRQGKQYLSLEFLSADVNGESRIVLRIDYTPGPEGWAGLYWQHPDGNWGTLPGMNLIGATAISFLARGENGGEVVEFKSGGIRGIYSDSYERSLGKVSLQRSWTAYQIPLSDQDLSSVIGAFAWSAPAPRTRMTFYIANLEIR